MNTDSIHSTIRSPFSAEPSWGYFTKKSGKLFANVFTWPTGGCVVVHRRAERQPLHAVSVQVAEHERAAERPAGHQPGQLAQSVPTTSYAGARSSE
jgi:hypothetical protein